MNLRKSYIFGDGTTDNLKRAWELSADERNSHHTRAKWLTGLGVLLSITIVAVPIGVPLFLWGMHEANTAEAKRSE